ncbi:MAG TPA: hypothetical protein DEB70_10880 [Planctomycetaceae bacterium]|nr:hypothetical protein [Planctomycetaceae bacterium]
MSTNRLSTECFQQACPICGRAVRIELNLKFKTVVCNHCGGNFSASGQNAIVASSSSLPGRQGRKVDALLLKSNRLLQSGKISQC